MKSRWHRLISSLTTYYNNPNWWPGEDSFQIAVSAVLTQNTNWRNVEKALANMKRAGIKSWETLQQTKDLEEIIKPAGFAKRKSATLKALAKLMLANPEPPRSELLAVKGIGPETADSILLYALNKPEMVVDAYTYRILTRCGVYNGSFDYDRLKAMLTEHTHDSVALMKAIHAAFVEVGKAYCSRTPKCEHCPLSSVKEKGGECTDSPPTTTG